MTTPTVAISHGRLRRNSQTPRGPAANAAVPSRAKRPAARRMSRGGGSPESQAKPAAMWRRTPAAPVTVIHMQARTMRPGDQLAQRNLEYLCSGTLFFN